jgi:O-succinylbenzoate synthase
MKYQVQFRPYQRSFKPPLKTAHGVWAVRQGILLKLQAETGQVSWGEIAPIAWFGSETLAQALQFCQQLPNEISEAAIFAIPEQLPACQFGFESALRQPLKVDRALTFSALLPAGDAALTAWQALWHRGNRTFKWKIGVTTIAAELDCFQALVSRLPDSTKLRLDANGSLSYAEACLWLQTCDLMAGDRLSSSTTIEFLEQPLPLTEFAVMQQLSQRFQTPIALDESVATFTQLQACYQQGWRGIFVIKPAIVGSPRRLRQFCQQHRVDAVFSTAFETAIGRQAGLQLAAELGSDRAVGYGTTHWFHEPETEDFEQLWQL